MREKGTAVVVMIDEAETLAHIEGSLEYLRNTFSRLGEEGALYSLAICGKTGLFQTVSEVFSPLERFFQPLTLMPFTAEETVELLGKASSEAGISFETQVRQEIIRQCEGQPYAIQVYGYCLFDAAIRHATRTVDQRLVQTVEPGIHKMLDTQLFERRLQEGVGHSSYKLRILRKLSEAKNDSFSFTDIARLTGVRKKQGLGVYLSQLVDSGCLTKDVSTGKYGFFMKMFKIFVRQKLSR